MGPRTAGCSSAMTGRSRLLSPKTQCFQRKSRKPFYLKNSRLRWAWVDSSLSLSRQTTSIKASSGSPFPISLLHPATKSPILGWVLAPWGPWMTYPSGGVHAGGVGGTLLADPQREGGGLIPLPIMASLRRSSVKASSRLSLISPPGAAERSLDRSAPATLSAISN